MDQFLSNDFIGISLLIFMILSALISIISTNLLTATVALALFSLLMALQYLVLKAPDVAITEAAVGAGIGTVLFVLAIFLTSETEIKRRKVDYIAMPIMIITSIVLFIASFSMPGFGKADNPAHLHVVPYYLNNSPQDIAIPNVVTSILASYRGFDTFGETIVIFVAGVCVAMLLIDSNRAK